MGKPALPLLDVPLGAWSVAALLQACARIVANVSHLGPELRAVLEPLGEGRLEFLDEGAEAYGSGGTLVAVRGRVEERIVVYNGDLLADLDVRALLTTHASLGAPVTVAAQLVDRGADFEVAGDRATGGVDRRRADPPGALYLGVAVLEREALEELPDRRPLGLGESLLLPLADRGDLALHYHDGYGFDVGSPERYLDASLDVLSGDGPYPPAGIPGRVVELDGGRAYIGPGAQVEGAALERGAIVLESARVQPGARVRDSIVWPGETVPAGTELDGVVWARSTAVRARPGP